MKKICSVLLIFTLILGLSACKTPMEEVENGALAETPVEEQEPTKEEQAPESKEETQEPSQEVPEETDTTQPPENTAVEEPRMEHRFVCQFLVSFNEEPPQYTLEDFSDLGIEQIKTISWDYFLYGTFTEKREIKAIIDVLYTLPYVSSINLDYTAYYVEPETDPTEYPSLDRPCREVGSHEERNVADLYDGRVRFWFRFGEADPYEYLLSLEDFPNISAEACEFQYHEGLHPYSHPEGTIHGYVNLTDYSEEALKKAIDYIQSLPYVHSVEQYREGKYVYLD